MSLSCMSIFPRVKKKNIYLAEYFEITNPCGPCLQVTQSKINYDFLTAHARALSSVLRPDNWSGQLRRNGARSSLLFWRNVRLDQPIFALENRTHWFFQNIPLSNCSFIKSRQLVFPLLGIGPKPMERGLLQQCLFFSVFRRV